MNTLVSGACGIQVYILTRAATFKSIKVSIVKFVIIKSCPVCSETVKFIEMNAVLLTVSYILCFEMSFVLF